MIWVPPNQDPFTVKPLLRRSSATHYGQQRCRAFFTSAPPLLVRTSQCRALDSFIYWLQDRTFASAYACACASSLTASRQGQRVLQPLAVWINTSSISGCTSSISVYQMTYPPCPGSVTVTPSAIHCTKLVILDGTALSVWVLFWAWHTLGIPLVMGRWVIGWLPQLISHPSCASQLNDRLLI